jgi:hypothetical protein
MKDGVAFNKGNTFQWWLYIIEDSQHETIEMKDGVAFNTGNTF